MTSVTVVVVVVVVGVGVVSTLLKGKHRTHHSGFYPRDAILARYYLRAYLSVCQESVFRRNGWSDRADLWHRVFL